jgi:phospholipase C
MAGFDFARLQHVVVLMMENRSFDHMLGSLRLVEGRPIDGLQPQFSNPDSHGVEHRVAALAGTARVSRFAPDPPHEPDPVALQLAGPMRGFIKAFEASGAAKHITIDAPEQVLGYYTRAELPITYFLADEFTLCERWFTPIPTSTIPNRLYSTCGQSKGYRDAPRFNTFIDVPSIFDKLEEDWCVYAGSLPLVLLIGGVVRHFQNANNIRHLRDFQRDVQRNRLPSVVWIEPVYDFAAHLPFQPFGEPNDDHPPDAIERGQQLMADVYNALVAVPEVWEKTVLVVTYDEHGGFFDHVEPPSLLPGEIQADGFQTYGPRVPAVVVSPFAERGAVWSDRMDHCSILKMICDWRGIPYLTPRVASTAIRSVADVLTSTARTDRPTAPSPPVVVTAALEEGPPPPLTELGHQLEDLRLALREEYPDQFAALFPEMAAAPPIPRGRRATDPPTRAEGRLSRPPRGSRGKPRGVRPKPSRGPSKRRKPPTVRKKGSGRSRRNR